MESQAEYRAESGDTFIVGSSMHNAKLPCLPLLMGKLAFKKSTFRIFDTLPSLSAVNQDFTIDAKHLEKFKHHCGYGHGNGIPATYLQTLSMPLVMHIMSSPGFPLRALGKMHLRNSVSVIENFDPRQPITLKASVGNSLLTSRGLEWDMDFTAVVDNQLVWSGSSTYLHNCETGMKPRTKPRLIRGDNPQDWEVPKGTGRRYGRISGDCNPIHLSSITARLFGFRSAIAHGMWSKTRCLAALEKELPEAGYSVDVSFYRPLFLPSKVKFYTRQIETGQHFSLFNARGEKAYLVGLIT